MKRQLMLVAVAATTIGIAAVLVAVSVRWGRTDESTASSAQKSGSQVSQPSVADDDDPLARLEHSLDVAQETWEDVGAFGLRGGRKVRLHTADAAHGKSCLIESEASEASSMCLDRSLFGLHRAAFMIGSNGGPDRFSDLHLSGVAAPAVGGVTLVLTDGSSSELALTDDRAFLFESKASELARGVGPAALRLFGQNGRLLETIPIPDEN